MNPKSTDKTTAGPSRFWRGFLASMLHWIAIVLFTLVGLLTDLLPITYWLPLVIVYAGFGAFMFIRAFKSGGVLPAP